MVPLAVEPLYQAELQYAHLCDQGIECRGNAGEIRRSVSCTEMHTVELSSLQSMGKPVTGADMC